MKIIFTYLPIYLFSIYTYISVSIKIGNNGTINNSVKLEIFKIDQYIIIVTELKKC